MLGHAGGTGGYHTFIGFSKPQRRGVVVLSNQQGIVESEPVGWLILERIALTPELANILVNGREKELVGIGVALEFERSSRTIRIGKVLPHSPASDAGISAGSVVRKVGDISLENKTLLQCQSLIRGAAGTTVELELESLDRGETKTVAIVRGKFQI
jgi:S1-C subfamily serine protease